MAGITDTRATMYGRPSVAARLALGATATGAPRPHQGGSVELFDGPPACIQAP
jgi:hypothetical protein